MTLEVCHLHSLGAEGSSVLDREVWIITAPESWKPGTLGPHKTLPRRNSPMTYTGCVFVS